MSICNPPFGANPDNGQGGGGIHSYITEGPIPPWAQTLITNADQYSGCEEVKTAVRDFLAQVDAASQRFREAVDGIELAYSKAIDEAAYEFRQKLLQER